MAYNNINIAFNINEQYLPYCVTTMASILKNAASGSFFNFYVFTLHDLGSELQSITIEEYSNFKIHNIVCDEKIFNHVEESLSLSRIPIADGSLRLLIPAMLKDIDKCIYLDCDIIVNTDIGRLYHEDLDGYCIGGVIPHRAHYWQKSLNPHRHEVVENFKLTNGFCINSGVMLFNLKQIREEQSESELLNAIEQYKDDPRIRGFDQDLINIVFLGFGREKIKIIDSRWNRTPLTSIMPLKEMFIIHYIGPDKPWNSLRGPYIIEYLEYARLTSYYPQIRKALLEIVIDKIDYLETKLYYKRYLRRRSLFDFRIFGKELFPRKVEHYNRKINAFLTQKREKEFYYDYIIQIKNFLENNK